MGKTRRVKERAAAHQEAREEVEELEDANAAVGGERVERCCADDKAGAHRAEAKDLDAQTSHPGVVHKGSGEVVPAYPSAAFYLGTFYLSVLLQPLWREFWPSELGESAMRIVQAQQLHVTDLKQAP